jgi:CAAX protease family protein
MVLAIVNRLFPVPIVNDFGSNVPVLIGLGVLALVLIALTRGRLGYLHYRQQEPKSIAV